MIPLFWYPRLYPSLAEHRRVEEQTLDFVCGFLDARYLDSPGRRTPPLEYAKRNFFSILFLSIYRALGIPAERRLVYGVINHCLRGIVTGADNLLDDEYKGLLPLAFPESALRFKSIMHLLLFDRVLFALTEQLAQRGEIAAESVVELHRALFEAIVPIGAEEAEEEGGVSQILTPAQVLRQVHTYKGGKLLCLAFIAPRLLEKKRLELVSQAERGVFSIGMALQLIDDLTDVEEDLTAGNHNYLVSTVAHSGNDEERRLLAGKRREANDLPIEEAFPESTRRVMLEAVSEAVHGFLLLKEAGYWCNRRQAYQLIRYLFKLRKVGRLLPFFPGESELLPGGLAASHPEYRKTATEG